MIMLDFSKRDRLDLIKGSGGFAFLDLHEQCSWWWDKLRKSKQKPTEEIDYLAIAGEISVGLCESTEELLTRRWVDSNARPDQIRFEDSQRLLVLHKCYADILLLSSIDVAKISSLGHLAQEIAKLNLHLSDPTILRSVKGPNFREALYSIQAVIRFLSGQPSDFLENLDDVIVDFEENALSTWARKFCPEKTLLVMLLRAWRGRLLEIEQSEKQPPLVLVPITESIWVGQNAQIRLGFGTQDGTRMLSESKIKIASDNGGLVLGSLELPLEILAPGVGRVRFRIGDLGGVAIAGRESVKFSASAGAWRSSCSIMFEDLVPSPEPRGQVSSIHKWLEATLRKVQRCDLRRIVISVGKSSFRTVDLGPEAVHAQLKNLDCRVERIVFEGFAFVPPTSDKAVSLIEAKNYDHASALKSYLSRLEDYEVFQIHLAGYIGYRFPGLMLESGPVELLEEYLRPIDDTHVVGKLVDSLGDVLTDNDEWVLTEEAVEKARAEAPVTQAIIERIEDLKEAERTVLGALRTAVNAVRKYQPGPDNPSVNVGMVARSLSLDSAHLEEILRALEEDEGLVEREGRLQYRFANRVYLEAVKEFFGEEGSD
jgi:hypothetical protein